MTVKERFESSLSRGGCIDNKLRRIILLWIWAVMWAMTGIKTGLDECSGMYGTLTMKDNVDAKGHD